jgi:Pectate lyase superfamily protein/Right handed beta helix region
MTNFLADNTTLSEKQDARALPASLVSQAHKYISAADINAHRQALIDIRDSFDSLSVKSFGAVGDGTTNDRTALQAAIVSAMATGKGLHFPPGTYKISRSLLIDGANRLTLTASAFATIVFPSDDVTIDGDVLSDCIGLGNPDQAARAGFMIKNSTGVSINNLTFQGGTHPQIFDINIGCAFYIAGTTTNTQIIDCAVYNGSQAVLHEQNGDTNHNLTVIGTHSYNCRSTFTPAKGTTILGCHFYRPMTQDRTGRVTSFFKSGTSITIACPRGSFQSADVGKYVYISGSTSNDGGPYLITAITPKTGTAAGTLTYTRASGGASELSLATTRFFVPNGERVGVGNGATALAKSGSTMTLTKSAAGAAFTSADIGKAIRITGATTAANNTAAVILTVPSSTTLTYTYAGGTAETYAGAWSIDSYDNVRDSGMVYGSTHAIYMFAGRGEVSIIGCRFYGIRGSAVKISGSTAPIESVIVQGCFMQECASAFLFGADDSQEHTGLKFEGNIVRDCANGRVGWTEQCAFYGFGARTVAIKNNTIVYTHDEIGSVDGRGAVGGYGIYIGRYRAGLSQPVENVDISGNQITADPLNCTASQVAATAIHVDSCGLLARYRTSDVSNPVTLTYDALGTTHDPTGALGATLVELYDPNGYFCQEMADGGLVSIVNTTDTDNIVTDAVIRKVVGTSRLYYTNATAGASTATGAAAGTYRIKPPVGRRGSTCKIHDNTIAYVGGIAIQSTSNVGPDITENTVHGVGTVVEDNGSLAPKIAGNRLVGQSTLSAGIRLNSGTTWPIVHDNTVTAHGDHLATKASFGEIGVGVNNGTRVDYPLLGKRGKVKPTEGKAEAVFGYGPTSDFVDGDTIGINGVTYTYKATGPTGNQFNTYAGLLALVQGGGATYTAADYGAQFAAPVTTTHGRVRLTAANTSNGAVYIDTVNTCNPTVLVVPRNTAGSESYLQGQGESGTLSTDAVRSVIWSPLADYSGQVVLTASESTAAALLAAGGYWQEKVANNAGACEVLRHNDTAGTEEFRWSIQ